MKDKNQKYYHILTHGCQMNEHDSEKISWVLEDMGYKYTDTMEESDFIIFNTCLVRENAELKLFGQVGALKNLKLERPDLIISICGCMMQVEGPRNFILDKFRYVDIIFGTNNIHKLPQLISKHLQTGETIVDIIEDTYEIPEDVDANRISSFKGYVTIMYGCNNFCTYCIVPYARGREKSREPEDILKEIEKLAQEGYKEITLLGQNVNSYGKTLEREERYSFANLLADVNKIEGLERIRFMTSHPKDISDELIEAFGQLDKLSKHIHLPVQSGSNKILKEMNRHYTREDYLEKVGKLKKICPDIALSTDIIVGFPGETEEDFEDTLSLVSEVGYDAAYTFLYSMREGTKAAERDDQVDDKLKHERFQKLLDLIYPMFNENNQKAIGNTYKVLVEGTSKNNDDILAGRTDGSKLVHFQGDRDLIGSIVEVKIEEANSFTHTGKLV